MRASQRKKTLSTATFTVAEWDPQSLTDRNWTPEQYLQAEVLLQAWHDLKTPAYPYSPRARRLVNEALAWVESNDEGWVFSSVNICHSLEIDIDALRGTFRAVVEKRDIIPPREQSEHGTLIDKLMQQIPQREVIPCDSKASAYLKRNALATDIPRLLNDSEKYRLRTYIIDSTVICWIEEGPKRCLYCETTVPQDRRVCRFHRREAKLRAGARCREKKRENVWKS